jgi:hypothetical protein
VKPELEGPGSETSDVDGLGLSVEFVSLIMDCDDTPVNVGTGLDEIRVETASTGSGVSLSMVTIDLDTGVWD